MERVLFELEDLVYDELKKIVKQQDISPTELSNATNAVCLLLKIDELKNGSMPENEGYSNRYMPRNSYGYREGMTITPAMDRNYSYTHSMMYPNSNYSMNNGYSRHSIKDRAIDRLERMMDEAQSESEKESIKKMIVGLEHMELY